ncbi:hypothetical protein [Luteitalea sp.]|uniref:hypothetical protein n=1 Tax=Luteitalea sp. TaxID=2004800 RepID=UPI0025B7E6E9|nr:hypothetical protein [Luteitalea sp.]
MLLESLRPIHSDFNGEGEGPPESAQPVATEIVDGFLSNVRLDKTAGDVGSVDAVALDVQLKPLYVVRPAAATRRPPDSNWRNLGSPPQLPSLQSSRDELDGPVERTAGSNQPDGYAAKQAA